MKYSPLMPMLVNEEVVFVDIQNQKVYKAIVTSPSDGVSEWQYVKWQAEDSLVHSMLSEIYAHQTAITPEIPEEIIEQTLHTQQQLQGRRPPSMPTEIPPCKNKEN